MNRRITKLYGCCVDNKIIVCQTNFKGFYEQFSKITSNKCNNSTWYSNRFKEHGEFEQWIEGKLYYFQRLV